MRRRWMAVLLAAALLLGVLPMAALAEELPEAAEKEEAALPEPQGEEKALPEPQAEEDGAQPEEDGGEEPARALADEEEPGDPTEVTVSTSDQFRAALKNDDVTTIYFRGRLVVEYEENGDNDLEAELKNIYPYERDYDHNQLIFAEGVTMTHISAHHGNRPNMETQSVGQIYDSDWDRAAAAAEGLLGWYEYHDEDNGEDDPYAGMRVCYAMHCGSWQDAVEQAADLTAEDWNHKPLAGGDENEIVFLMFGYQRDSSSDIVIGRDVTVDVNMDVMGGQNLVVQNNAVLAAGNLNVYDMRVDDDAAADDTERYQAGRSDVTVKAGSRIEIRNWSMVDSDGTTLSGNGCLNTHGKILLENKDTGLTLEEDCTVWSLYKRVLYSTEDLGDPVGPTGKDSELPQLSGSISLTRGRSMDLYIYQQFFEYEVGEEEGEDGTFTNGRRIGWRYCKESREEFEVPSGITLTDLGEEDGRLRLTADAAGTYKLYKHYYDEELGEEVNFAFPLTITVTNPSSSGGSGGGSSGGSGGGSKRPSSAAGANNTTTKTNADGSTTTTVTAANGTVTETTKYPDGAVATVTTTKDGEVTTTVRRTDGTTGTTTVKDGVTTASAQVSASAAENAVRSGGTVTLPVEVPNASGGDDAARVEVRLPGGTEDVRIEVPVERVTPGTVAAVEGPGGALEIVRTSVTTADGVALTVSGSVTLRFFDNSRDFADVPGGYWAAASIDFVTSRGLFNGTGASTFDPGASTTRAQLMTALARLDGADTSGSALEKGMAWAVAQGISDGTNPGARITRQQLTVMLWRYAGSPAASQELTHSDADQVSGYAAEAMRWAVAQGIVTGNADGTLNPQGLATRAQMAAMMTRFVNALNG